MPFLLAEILNFQGSTHRIGVGSFSYIFYDIIVASATNNFKYKSPIISQPILRNRC